MLPPPSLAEPALFRRPDPHSQCSRWCGAARGRPDGRSRHRRLAAWRAGRGRPSPDPLAAQHDLGPRVDQHGRAVNRILRCSALRRRLRSGLRILLLSYLCHQHCQVIIDNRLDLGSAGVTASPLAAQQRLDSAVNGKGRVSVYCWPTSCPFVPGGSDHARVSRGRRWSSSRSGTACSEEPDLAS